MAKSNDTISIFMLIVFALLILIWYKINVIEPNTLYRPNMIFNYPTRIYNSTRNMSYDLRCEPKIPKNNYIFPRSSIQPNIRRKCLDF